MTKHETIIARFLESHRFRPPGGKTMFASGNRRDGFGGVIITLFVDLEKRRQAEVLLLGALPRFFKGRGISEVSRILSGFLKSDLSANYELASGCFTNPPMQHLGDLIPSTEYGKIWEQLEKFIAGLRMPHLHLIPGHRIEPVSDFVTDELVLLRSDADLNDALSPKLNVRELKSGFFPPIECESFGRPLAKGTCLVGCFTEDEEFPEVRMRAIAGAIFMAAPQNESRVFNMALSVMGHVTVSEKTCSYVHRDPLIPPLYYPVSLGKMEMDFLEAILVRKAGDPRIQNALKIAYEGWVTKDREQFIQFSIAFDALFGIDGKVGASIREGILEHAPAFENIEEKARKLYALRNELAHGSSGSLETCDGYLKYFELFGKDPAREQFEILRTCVWSLARDR